MNQILTPGMTMLWKIQHREKCLSIAIMETINCMQDRSLALVVAV